VIGLSSRTNAGVDYIPSFGSCMCFSSPARSPVHPARRRQTGPHPGLYLNWEISRISTSSLEVQKPKPRLAEAGRPPPAESHLSV